MKNTTVQRFLKMEKLALIVFVFLYAQSAYADASPASKYIGKLTSDVTTVSPQQLRKMLDDKSDKEILLDVRTYYERNKTKTILGDKEIHMPRGFLEVKAWGSVPKDTPVIVYCSKGTRSKLAVKTLQDMGWTNVTSLEGGVEAWYKSKDEDCGCLPESKEIPDQKEAVSEGCKP